MEGYVLITTKYRGVYFGKLLSHTGDECELAEARMAIHWNTTEGVDELAKVGPNSGSKIGAEVPKIWLCGLTSVADCTEIAIAAWKSA